MPTFEFTSPEGKTYTVEGPAGATKEQAFQILQGQLGSAPVAKPRTLASEAMGSIPVQAAMGALRGAGSIGATLLRPFETADKSTARRKAMDEALQSMGADTSGVAFGAGKLGGEIAGTAGIGGLLGNVVGRVAPAFGQALSTAGLSSGAAPATLLGKAGDLALRSGAGAAVGGASAGLVGDDVKTGAMIGGMLPGVMQGAGKLGAGVGNMFRPSVQNAPLARKAIEEYGIPLGTADIAQGATPRAIRSILNDAPFTGSIGAAQRENVQQGFNRAIGETFGAPAPKLTADIVDQAKGRMGAEFDRLWGRNVLQVDDAMVQKIVAMQRQAAKLPKNEGQSLNAEIQDLLSKMQADEAGNVVIQGDVANKFQSYLRRRAESSTGLKHELGDLRQSVIDAFNRGISPADAEALTKVRGQYKAFKTVEPLLNKGEAGVAGRMPGDVPASLLPGAVASNYSRAAGTPLADLSQIGSQFMVDRVARTGGSTRAALQNTAIGAALMGGGMANPLLAAAAIPTAGGLNALLGNPAVAKRLLADNPSRLVELLRNPEAQQFLLRSAPISAQ